MSHDRFRIIGILGFLLLMAGCNRQNDNAEEQAASKPQPLQELIAVIDLNVVAQEIGAQAKIDRSLKEKEQELLEQFNGLREELGRRVTDLQQAGQDLNDQQKIRLQSLTAENRNKLTLQAQAAQSQLLAHHSQLKQKLLAQIRPVAYSVAQEKGMQIVLTVGQVYAAGPNVDITQDVVKRIQTLNKSAATEMPGGGTDGQRVAVLPGGGDFMPR
jgi:Skp family chaperone for outer membrane proteins